MKIYCCQFDIAWEDKEANFARVAAMLDAAGPQPGALVLLPEMFATGFSMHVASIAENRHTGPTARFLAQTARRMGIYLAGGFVTRRADGKARNELAVYSPDGARVAGYVKIHPFSYGQESRHYAGGRRVATFAWHQVTVAPFICYDLRFPEVFRHAVLAGAEVLLVMANWPRVREAHWLALNCARAIENQCFVASVNRCGRDPHIDYGGRSLIIAPDGEVLGDAGEAPRVISAQIDREKLRRLRRTFPALADIQRRFLGLPNQPNQS